MNLYALLAAHFPQDPTAPCMILPDGRIWTYGDVRRATGRMANLLVALGLKPGDRVAAQVDKSAEALVLYLATLRSGMVFLPLNPAYQRHELAYFLGNAEPGLFVACHTTLLNGSAMLWEAKFDAKRAAALLPQATVFMGVPTYYVRLLLDPSFGRDTCRNARLFVSGSAPLLKETFDEFKRRTGQTILERYGMSEGGMFTSNPYDGERRGGTVGLPLPSTEVRIVGSGDAPIAQGEIGGIQVRGANVFVGYWRMPEKTREEFTSDGFFRTGDLGSWDADGYLAISGRSKDLIISGGLNVYPKEIEEVIDALPGVVESAVIGLPHPDFGEAVTAVVVRQQNAAGAALSEAGIIAAVKRELAGFKGPKRGHLVDDLPRNAMGKVQKNLLRQSFT